MSGGKTSPELSRAAKKLSELIPQAGYRSLPGQTHNVAAKVLAPVLVDYFK